MQDMYCEQENCNSVKAKSYITRKCYKMKQRICGLQSPDGIKSIEEKGPLVPKRIKSGKKRAHSYGKICKKWMQDRGNWSRKRRKF